MMKYFQKKYALSEAGAKELVKGIVYSVLAYISLMLPVALLAYVLNDLLTPLLTGGDNKTNVWLYVIIGIVVLVVIYIMHYLQYTVTYMGTYQESERRRITLAEKLRVLPLRFFHERDLSDLTSTIMGDCSGFEHFHILFHSFLVQLYLQRLCVLHLLFMTGEWDLHCCGLRLLHLQ